MKSKMVKLYHDWHSCQPAAIKRDADHYMMESTKNPTNFSKVITLMGADGKLFQQYIAESGFSADSLKAKRMAAKFIVEEAASDPDNQMLWKSLGGNSIVSQNDVTGNGVTAEIIQAIVSGQMDLAAALTLSMWDKITVGDLNGIGRMAQIHSFYNASGAVPKNSGRTEWVELAKKTDITPNKFQAMAFPMSDPKNTEIFSAVTKTEIK